MLGCSIVEQPCPSRLNTDDFPLSGGLWADAPIAVVGGRQPFGLLRGICMKKVKTSINILPKTQWLLDYANLMEAPPGILNIPDEHYPDYLKKRKKNLEKYVSAKSIVSSGSLEYVDVDKFKKSWTSSYNWTDTSHPPRGTQENFSLDSFKKLVLESGLPSRKLKNVIEIREYPRYESDRVLDFLEREPLKLHLKKNSPVDERAKSEIAYHYTELRTALEIIVNVNKKNTKDKNVASILPYATQKLGYPFYPIILWGLEKSQFIHDNSFPQQMISSLLDFYINQKELHPYLRRCHTCARFFILQGKECKYCTPQCRVAFNERSRLEDAKKKENSDAEKRKKKKKELEERLLKFNSKSCK